MRKKTFSTIVLLALATAFAPEPVSAQGGPVTVQALMIQAQNESAPTDARLQQVEYRLRRVFGFLYYRYLGEGRVTLAEGAEGTINLPQGHRLAIRMSQQNRAEVRWIRDGEALLSTGVALSRDAPIVLGGVPSNGGVVIVVLTVR